MLYGINREWLVVFHLELKNFGKGLSLEIDKRLAYSKGVVVL